MEKYNPGKIEKRWRERWEKTGAHKAKHNTGHPKYYCLDMFPYPSGEGLHVGHWRGYVLGDVLARSNKMKGKNVLHPMGWDAFGLPAENAAIKKGTHPAQYTKAAIANMKRQLQEISAMYDWSREINSSDPSYYKWTQWLFLQLYKNGLAYRAKVPVNWCPSCQTVLANEQVINGHCERCDTLVTKKELEQWFFKITDFADDLISGLDSVEWPERVKTMQKNWIGRSEGALVKFQISNDKSQINSKNQIPKEIEVFTTRVDTIFGCTYVVLAPEHPFVASLLKEKGKIKNEKVVRKYIEKAKKESEIERTSLEKEKTGVRLEGIEALNPFNGEKVPVWIADYALMEYGTGAVMAVPAHDERDFEFAKKYHLPIKWAVSPVIEIDKRDFPKKGIKIEKRDMAIAIVKHWEKEEYICLDWGKYGWKTFVVGGVEEGESFEDAAAREAREETGYQNIKSIRKIDGKISLTFYAHHKKINRLGNFEGFLVELKDGRYIEPKKEDTKHHKAVWIKKEEV